MSECLDPPSPMTGSTESGPPPPPPSSSSPPPPPPPPSQAQKDSLLVPVRSLSLECQRTRTSDRDHRDSRGPSMSRKMSATAAAVGNAQPIQLTPLWEHVVRTRKFPTEIDTRLTFLEIGERLRDPEWEVRQHALRVLMDVLPTLNAGHLDKVMQPVLPELINNLGHLAPAVRKGALDTIRVYLLHTQDKECIVKNILRDGLGRSEPHDPLQLNITTGVILSAPSLLFPSSSSPSPDAQLVKETTIALASRLAQVPHQEAVLKSLLKIRDAIGSERFDSYLAEYDDKLKKNIEILSKIYKVKPSRKHRGNSVSARNIRNTARPEKKEDHLERKWDSSDSDTSGIAEEEDEIVNGTMPGARVVLETEIKFNEETAITMTILEEKAESENEQDEESGTDVRNDAEVAEAVGDSAIERKKTPRRVHFGGEIVKLRTPDSDETESIELIPKTRIPLPVTPATKMPEHRRPSSQPCSPHRERKKLRRQARSASNSPKREVYIHNADLSPKKSILTRTNSPLYIIKPSDQADAKKRSPVKREEKDLSKSKKENDTSNKEDNLRKADASNKQTEESNKEDVPSARAPQLAGFVPIESVERDSSTHTIISPNSVEVNEDRPSTKVEQKMNKIDSESALQSSQNKIAAFETFPRQERNYILMELSSPESKGFRDNKDVIGNSSKKESLTNKWENATKSSSIDVSNSPFGSVVDETEIDRDFLADLNITSNPIDPSVSVPSRIRSDRYESSWGEVSGGTGEKDASGQDVIQGVVDLANGNIERRPPEEGDSECGPKSDGDQKIVACVPEKNASIISEGEYNSKEPNWEELGLVGIEVLEDLHNREDWRARVRGLERVASALRTSSALIAIEPRLGSLLHAVLGCERSCRVAAAGLAVAKVVVTGVGEDALRRRLSLLAWGLARQGGPSAAQLARTCMLRLRPIRFLEQLLQPQCLNARNAKTRENALQLLIFSLVTFPSTEFKVQTVASKVVKMVADRRRRVRQAALDTLAVLAQIYDPEEVLAAAKRAADRRHDGEAMLSAIRARLARKSLPLVSADGLVVYGLQISPTLQIATGSDVDWIVAGSGSVSPGTGRTRGQIIATTGTDRARLTRTMGPKNRTSPWMERPTLGSSIGSAEEAEQPVAWQIVPAGPEDDTGYQDQLNRQDERNNNTETSAGDCSRNPPQQESAEYRKSEESVEFRPSTKSDEIIIRQPDTASKSESRIPILSTARSKTLTSVRDRSENLSLSVTSVIAGRRMLDNTTSFAGSAENMLGPYSTAYQRRKHYTGYNSLSKEKNLPSVHTGYPTSIEITSYETPENISKSYRRLSAKERFVQRSEEKEFRPQSVVRTQQTTSAVQEYSLQRQGERFVDGTAYHRNSAPSRAMNGEGQYCQYRRESAYKNILSRPRATQRNKDALHQKQNSAGLNSPEPQTNGHFPTIENVPSYRRRLRSLSPSQMYHRKHYVRRASKEYQTASMYDIDKAVNEEEYNERNRILYFPDALGPQEIPLNSSGTPVFEEDNAEGSISKSASNTSSEISRSIDQTSDERNGQVFERLSRSSTPRSQETQAAFNVIVNSAGSAFRESVEPFIIPLDQKLEATVSGTISSADEDISKYWSSEEETNSSVRARTVSRTEFHSLAENESNSTFEGLEDTQEESVNLVSVRRRSVISILSSERVEGNEDSQVPTAYPGVGSPKDFQEIQSINQKRRLSSPEDLDTVSSPQLLGNDTAISKSPAKSGSRGSLQKSISNENDELGRSKDVKSASATQRGENLSFLPFDASSASKERKERESPTIVIASRPHSILTEESGENNLERRLSFGTVNDAKRFLEDSSVNEALDDRQSKDSASETNTEPAILRIESQTMEPIHPSRRMSSKMSRGTKTRTSGPRGVSDKAVEKSKGMIQQCFAQLENKDWEVALKGLKSLSQIAKQHPELLDLCGIGTIGRILGRLIKSLRSQVARAACQAAGDLFAAHIRSIDQDIDDIAGPLLHRTADTNRFLRGDCNTALDRMVEHLSPHKTIGIIIHRGGNHQNPVVRAAAARLLSVLVDRIGPEQTMILPRDTRDKLLNTGARLLTDGNLDARNHAKKMFKRFTRCEGFRKVLTDAVPESTLRHIDKALKSL